MNVDVGHLLRIPAELDIPPEREDEFECLNLDVTVPSLDSGVGAGKLPVLVWIHGGSQVVTFASGASKVCDATRLVSDSISQGRPIIVVSMNYRLNIFAFGSGACEKNLALKDQMLAIQWVHEHISGFGGDPNSITLAGESAGAVYCHAHLVTGAPVQQAILSSGSLYLSPPQPEARGLALVQTVTQEVRRLGSSSLDDAPVENIIKAQESLGIRTLWLQMEPELEHWENKAGSVNRLIVGDVEYESVIWRNGIEAVDAASIVGSFDKVGAQSAALKSLYGVIPERTTSCKLGALDFINDLKFTLPNEMMVDQWRKAGRSVYRYVVDQANPWQPSSRAHHAVDLILLFGGFDLSFDPAAEKVGMELRKRWIAFINGDEPWNPETYFGFGPHGESKELDKDGFAARRRTRHLTFLRELDPGKANEVFGALAAGRISLLN